MSCVTKHVAGKRKFGDISADKIEITGSLLLPDGSSASPSLAFSSAIDTGLSLESGTLKVNTSGVERVLINDSSVILKQQLLCSAGTLGAPGIGFDADADTGFYWIAEDNIAAVVGGTKVMDLTAAGNVEATLGMRAADGTEAAPGYAFISASDTGLYTATDEVGVSKDGVAVFKSTEVVVAFDRFDTETEDRYATASLAALGTSELTTNQTDLTNLASVTYTAVVDDGVIAMHDVATYTGANNQNLSSTSLGSSMTGIVNGTDLTVGFWLYRSSLDNNRGFFTLDGGTIEDAIQFYCDGISGMIVRASDGFTEYIKAIETTYHIINTWNHYVFTFSTTTGNVLYKNGVSGLFTYQSGTSTASNYIPHIPTRFGVGLSLYTNSPTGHIARPFVSTGVYSAATVLALYEYQKDQRANFNYSHASIPGIVTHPDNSRFEGTRSSVQAINTATQTSCSFSSTATVNMTFVSPICNTHAAGVYTISYSLNYAANVTGYREAWISVDSDALKHGRSISHTNSATIVTTLTGVWTGYLAIDVDITIETYQTSGGDLDTGGAGDLVNFFTVSKIA